MLSRAIEDAHLKDVQFISQFRANLLPHSSDDFNYIFEL